MSYEQFAYCYDGLMQDMPYAEWMEFANRCWEKYGRPETVVELGCGTGNLTLPLAASGLAVYGIDLSDDMLAVAERKSAAFHTSGSPLQAAPGSIVWLQQDMCEWELPRKVDAAVSFCDCLNYLTEEADVIRTFRQTFDGLADKGLFLFDVHTKARFEEYAAEQPFVLNEPDIAYIWTCDYDPERLEIGHELTIFTRMSGNEHGLALPGAGVGKPFIASGTGHAAGVRAAAEQPETFRRFEESHTQRAYAVDWLTAQLLAAGFAHVDCYSDFSMEPADEGTLRAFFAARKG